MSKKRPPIWKFFMATEDTRLGNCNVCGENVSRGGKTTKTYNTTNSVYHLKSKHHDKFREYSKLMEATCTKEAPSTTGKETTLSKQLTLVESTERSHKLIIPHRLSVSAIIRYSISVIGIYVKFHIGATLLQSTIVNGYKNIYLFA